MADGDDYYETNIRQMANIRNVTFKFFNKKCKQQTKFVLKSECRWLARMI